MQNKGFTAMSAGMILACYGVLFLVSVYITANM